MSNKSVTRSTDILHSDGMYKSVNVDNVLHNRSFPSRGPYIIQKK